MNKRNHATRESIRKELVENGFVVGFSSPGRPELWLKPGDRSKRLAIQREQRARSERWHIIPYPEPSTCSQYDADELAKRDGIILQAGKMPELTVIGSDETEWLDD